MSNNDIFTESAQKIGTDTGNIEARHKEKQIPGNGGIPFYLDNPVDQADFVNVSTGNHLDKVPTPFVTLSAKEKVFQDRISYPNLPFVRAPDRVVSGLYGTINTPFDITIPSDMNYCRISAHGQIFYSIGNTLFLNTTLPFVDSNEATKQNFVILSNTQTGIIRCENMNRISLAVNIVSAFFSIEFWREL